MPAAAVHRRGVVPERVRRLHSPFHVNTSHSASSPSSLEANPNPAVTGGLAASFLARSLIHHDTVVRLGLPGCQLQPRTNAGWVWRFSVRRLRSLSPPGKIPVPTRPTMTLL